MSNSRIVEWEDGTYTLHIGSDVYDIAAKPIAGDTQFIFLNHNETRLAENQVCWGPSWIAYLQRFIFCGTAGPSKGKDAYHTGVGEETRRTNRACNIETTTYGANSDRFRSA